MASPFPNPPSTVLAETKEIRTWVSALADFLCWHHGYLAGSQAEAPPIDTDGIRQLKHFLELELDRRN